MIGRGRSAITKALITRPTFGARAGREYKRSRRANCAAGVFAKANGWFWKWARARDDPLLGAFEHVVLVDYSRTQLQQAQARLGCAYTYVAASVYNLPLPRRLRRRHDGAGDASSGGRSGALEVHAALRPAAASSRIRQQTKLRPLPATCWGCSAGSVFAGAGGVREFNFDFHRARCAAGGRPALWLNARCRTTGWAAQADIPPALLAPLDGWCSHRQLDAVASVFVKCAVWAGRPMPIASVAGICAARSARGSCRARPNWAA